MNTNLLFNRFSSERLSEPEVTVSEHWKRAVREKFAEVSWNEFMNRFMPSLPVPARSRYKSTFMGMSRSACGVRPEKLLECFCMCLQRHRICPGWKLLFKQDILNGESITSTRPGTRQDDDNETSIRPYLDGALFQEEKTPNDERTWREHQAMSFTFVADNVDPFEDGIFNTEVLQCRRRLIASAEQTFSYQHRSSLCSVLIIGISARLLRWDRCGLIFTEKFNFRQNPELLGEFLSRFSHLSTVQQGYDTSVTAVEKGSSDYILMKKLASSPLETKDYVRDCFARSLDESFPWWKIRVDSQEANVDTDGAAGQSRTAKYRFYLVGKPHFQASGLAGHGTRGYIAVDCTNELFVYLKDVWRFDIPGVKREGDILLELNENEVANVPTLVSHGDVLGQCTVTHDVWNVRNAGNGKPRIKKQLHYRVVVAEIGRPLHDFRRSLDLVVIIYDCLQAHRQAYERCQLLHHDISPGNILIVERSVTGGDGKEALEFGGLLNDWELAMPEVPDDADGASKRENLGTWAFLSAMSLRPMVRGIHLSDELESFFHVMLYMSIKYLPHNCTDVASFIRLYFDECKIHNGKPIVGSLKLLTIRLAKLRLGSSNIHFGPPHFRKDDYPLDRLLKILLSWLQAYYYVVNHDREQRSRDNSPVDPRSAEDNSGSHVANQKALPIDMTSYYERPVDSDTDEDEEQAKQREQAREAKALEDAKTLQAYREMANNLNSHHTIVNLFEKYFRMRWPLEDKFIHSLVSRNEQGSSSSTTTSRKRASDGEMPSSKRLKSSGSRHSHIQPTDPDPSNGAQDNAPRLARKPPATRARNASRTMKAAGTEQCSIGRDAKVDESRHPPSAPTHPRTRTRTVHMRQRREEVLPLSAAAPTATTEPGPSVGRRTSSRIAAQESRRSDVPTLESRRPPNTGTRQPHRLPAKRSRGDAHRTNGRTRK